MRLDVSNDIHEFKETVRALQQSNRELKMRLNELAMLNRISQIMAIASDLQSALETVIEKIAEILNARDVGVALVDRIRKKLTIVAHHTTQQDENKLVNFELPDTAIAEKLMVNGESVIISDAQNNALIQPVRDIIRSRGIESLMVVPLKVSGNILGIIMVSTDSKKRKFTDSEVKLVETSAGHIAAAIENKRLLQESKKARREAEKANRIKSDLLANMPHEIRTPMNAVIGFLEVTLDDPSLTPFQRDNLKTVHHLAKSLLALINDILDVSKLESGKLKLENNAFELPKMIKEALSTLEYRAHEKGLSMVLSVAPELPTCFCADSTRLRQILINLVGNAVKFTEKGRIDVKVAPWKGKDFVHFAIIDTGIAADKLQMIFSPFIQADGSTSRKFGGTGLGTTISKQLTELMEG